MTYLPEQGNSKPTDPKHGAPKTENDKIDAISERIIAAFVKINRANRKADAAENERNHRREKRKFKVEIFEIFLVAVYATFTVFEWHTFSTESTTMQNELQLVQSNSVAEQQIAIKQLKLMQGQLEQMKRAPELDERAWLFTALENDALNMQSNDCTFTIRIKNTGKTPAVNIGTWEATTFDTNQIKSTDQKVDGLNYALAPNEYDLLSFKFRPDILYPLADGKIVYVFGTVFYSDVFGRSHWTQFSYAISNRGGIMSQLLIHNSCDTEQSDTNN